MTTAPKTEYRSSVKTWLFTEQCGISLLGSLLRLCQLQRHGDKELPSIKDLSLMIPPSPPKCSRNPHTFPCSHCLVPRWCTPLLLHLETGTWPQQSMTIEKRSLSASYSGDWLRRLWGTQNSDFGGNTTFSLWSRSRVGSWFRGLNGFSGPVPVFWRMGIL